MSLKIEWSARTQQAVWVSLDAELDAECVGIPLYYS
jgi:hypothetical protein